MSDEEHRIELPRHFYGVVPVFLVDDVAKSAEYYRDVLGFTVDFIWDGQPNYGRVVRDEVVIDFIQSVPPGKRNSVSASGASQGADAVILVSEVEEVYIEIQERGAIVVERLAPREYGMLDCLIEDLNGYRLAIGGELEE